MTSSRPYLVRALYEWILDNSCTPHVVVNALADGVEVPQEHVDDGRIVLNISPTAVQDLHIDDHFIEFNGRFAGVPRQITVPMKALMGIYARENGQGMMFEEQPETSPDPDPSTKDEGGASAASKAEDKLRKPALRLVK
jgi:stringent starvation protein B